MIAREAKAESAADPLAPSARHEAAARRWRKLDRQRVELVERAEGIRLALAVTRNPGDAGRIPENLRERAAPYLRGAEDQPRKARKELAATERDHAKLRAIADRVEQGEYREPSHPAGNA